MTIHAYCLLALLMAGPGAEMGDVRAKASDATLPGRHVPRNVVLADVNQVGVRLVTPTAGSSSHTDLLAQIGKTLKAKGIEPIDGKTGLTSRLRIRIETVSVEDSGHTVYRVETVLNRTVTLAGRRSVRVQADVWRLPPAMKAVPDVELAETVTQAVLMQTEAFATACQAARDLAKRSGRVDGAPVPGSKAMPPGAGTSAVGLSRGPVVASKSSSVFHRPDCRWAQNIAERNRVTYASRDEAVRAGKRPCKSCKP